MEQPQNPTNIEITQALIDYYADPGDQRTISEIAKSLNISEATLYRHRKANHDLIFNEADKKRKQYMPILRSKGYKVLEQKLAKSPKALELLFKLTGELVERVEQTTKYESVDQKREKLAEAFSKLGFILTKVSQGPVAPPSSAPSSAPPDLKKD